MVTHPHLPRHRKSEPGKTGGTSGNGQGMTTVSLRITLRELAEIDAAASELGCYRTEIIRARLRWAATTERVMAATSEPTNFIQAPSMAR